MMGLRKEFMVFMVSRILLIIALLVPSLAMATDYYVDPTFSGGSNDGSESNPWTDVVWATVNTSLASAPVTIYFSARTVGADVSETIIANGYLDRTDTSSNLLKLDGGSKYNTNDSSGSWTTQSGSAIFYLQSSGNPGIGWYVGDGPQSNIYLYKIKYNRFWMGGGDNLTIDSCVKPRTDGTTGNFLYMEYAHYYTNHTTVNRINDGLTIKNNSIFQNSGGETMYIAGGGNADVLDFDGQTVNFSNGQSLTGSTSGASATIVRHLDNGSDGWFDLNVASGTFQNDEVINGGGGGKAIVDGTIYPGPGHTNLLFENNVFTGYFDGTPSGQSDAIDIKDGLTNIIIRDNTITGFEKAGTHPIVTHSPAEIYRNKIYDNYGGIKLTQYWPGNSSFGSGTASATWTDPVRIYNNTFHKNGILEISEDSGNSITGTIEIFNNSTGWNSNSVNIGPASGDCTVKNNIFRGGTVTLSCGGAEDNDYNIITGTLSGASLGPNSLTSDPAYASSADLTIDSDSPAYNAGTTLALFSNDVDGVSRPQGVAWDIGAYEFESGEETPSSVLGGGSFGGGSY